MVLLGLRGVEGPSAEKSSKGTGFLDLTERPQSSGTAKRRTVHDLLGGGKWTYMGFVVRERAGGGADSLQWGERVTALGSNRLETRGIRCARKRGAGNVRNKPGRIQGGGGGKWAGETVLTQH